MDNTEKGNMDMERLKSALWIIRTSFRAKSFGKEYYGLFPQLEDSPEARELESASFREDERAVAYAEFLLAFLDDEVSELYGFVKVSEN